LAPDRTGPNTVANLRKQTRQTKEAISAAKEELHQIYQALHEVEVIPFARVVDYILPPQSIPEIQIVHRGKKSA
jgi:hypothetical protein